MARAEIVDDDEERLTEKGTIQAQPRKFSLNGKDNAGDRTIEYLHYVNAMILFFFCWQPFHRVSVEHWPGRQDNLENDVHFGKTSQGT